MFAFNATYHLLYNIFQSYNTDEFTAFVLSFLICLSNVSPDQEESQPG